MIWIGTSWKMNKTRAEARAFGQTLAARRDWPAGIQPFVIPPFTAIADVAEILRDTPVLVGAQNMHWAEAGAWTGEISARQIVDCGARLVEIGHSERRQYFGETDESVGWKFAQAQAHGLQPLVCIGETAEDRDGDRADTVLERQIRAALAQANGAPAPALALFAYEPVWAIGASGQVASPAYANARMRRISELLHLITGRKIACLYGGSVAASNCATLVTQPAIDGLFIGRAAWEADGYLDIVDRCARALSQPLVKPVGGAVT